MEKLSGSNVCFSCPSKSSCCVFLEAPDLFSSEIKLIKQKYPRLGDNFFEILDLPFGQVKRIRKTEDERCVALLANNQCSIYEDRPFDCRLFPLDLLLEGEHSFWWIVYDKFCSLGRESSAALRGIIVMHESWIANHLTAYEMEIYAQHNTQLCTAKEYLKLQPLRLNLVGIRDRGFGSL